MPEARWEIHFLRHADAGDAEAWRGDDAERPLSAKGVSQAERMAAFLGGIGFAPDAILTSPKLRATQTADIVAGAVRQTVTVDERLAGGFTIDGLRSLLDTIERRDPVRRVLLVGHDPDFSSVVSTLAEAKGLRLSTCTLARVDLDDRPARGAGSLRWLIPPDALEATS
jgi:phosphohistidine phosphatase